MTSVAAVILAGGRARRMGGTDKALLPLGGRPLLAHALTRLKPHCAPIVLSANGDPARFAPFGLPVVFDDPDHSGPLAGLLAGLDWLACHAPGAALALSVPCDTPFVPPDLVARLVAARTQAQAQVAVASSGGRTHHAVAVWPVASRNALRTALRDESLRAIQVFAKRQGIVSVEWGTALGDPFANINAPDDLARCERLFGDGSG